MQDKIIRDELGRIIYLQRSDGFTESTEYGDDGKIKKIETCYPQGQIEIEHFGSFTHK